MSSSRVHCSLIGVPSAPCAFAIDNRLHDVVRPHVGAPAEAAARIEGMDEDLLGLESLRPCAAFA